MIHVEFYGIPRARAGVADVTVDGNTLAEVVGELARRFPDFARDCVDEHGRLRRQVAANLNGEQFVSDPATPLQPGNVLLIMSADAGGS